MILQIDHFSSLDFSQEQLASTRFEMRLLERYELTVIIMSCKHAKMYLKQKSNVLAVKGTLN